MLGATLLSFRTIGSVPGFIAGTSKGVLRAMRLGLTSVGDIIPVDFPIAMMISAAWFTATHRPNNIMVYNCTSGQLNPLTWGQIHDNLMKSIYKVPKGGFRLFRHKTAR